VTPPDPLPLAFEQTRDVCMTPAFSNDRSWAVLFATHSLLVVLLGATMGCDEQTLGPQAEGDIDGTVQRADTDVPITGATVSTSPPTQSVSTSSDGAFQLSGVAMGNYTITAEKQGFESKTVSVRVDPGEATQATLRLEIDEDARAPSDSLTTRVEDFFTDAVNLDDSGSDSLFVTTEYSVVNDGDVRINTYEVYFEITTDGGSTYTHEVSGDTLAVNERDLRDFRVYTRQEQATDVIVTGVYTEAE